MKSRSLTLIVMLGVASPAHGFEARWRKDMRTMAETLSEALPIAISDTAYEKPAQQKKLAKSLRKLSKMATRIEASLTERIDDPVVPHVTLKMSRNFDRAAELLERGEAGAARGFIRTATSFCISCHTRAPGGSASVAFEPRVPQGLILGAADRAEFYAATRQFDKAIAAYEAVMKDRWLAAALPHRWAIAAKRMLAIMVRVRQEPRLALEILSTIRDEKTAPASLYRDALIWRGSVQAWLAESDSKPGGLARATELFEEGESLIRKTGSDEAGLIPFLRASAILHDVLSANDNDAGFAAALYLAGRTAEKLAPIVLWTLNESYFEACVRVVPHTAQAGQCFERYKAAQPIEAVTRKGKAVYFDDADERLSELERLASELESGR